MTDIIVLLSSTVPPFYTRSFPRSRLKRKWWVHEGVGHVLDCHHGQLHRLPEYSRCLSFIISRLGLHVKSFYQLRVVAIEEPFRPKASGRGWTASTSRCVRSRQPLLKFLEKRSRMRAPASQHSCMRGEMRFAAYYGWSGGCVSDGVTISDWDCWS
ncbi:hypothetical protein BC830DRAFT_208533 [Chytriomyces sp. MP71]|nr:hypothetical protein BC830DRAFT_208533 [Chytriomyces sp. MP71]